MTTPFCRMTRSPMVHPSLTTVCECARKSSPIRVSAVNGHQAVQHRVAANFHAFIHETVRADVRSARRSSRISPRRRSDESPADKPRCGKQINRPREIEIRVPSSEGQREAASRGARSIAAFSSTNTAEASVLASSREYFGFDRNVISPARAFSIPATP